MKIKNICNIILLSFLFFHTNSYRGYAQNRVPDDTMLMKSNRSSLKGTLGTYANPPRFADKKIDLDQLIAELQDLQANTYHWLVRETYDDLNVLKYFLQKANKAGIKVWVTLVPPSESPPITKVGYSEPYRLDFEKWAVELANLSLSNPNLVAWSIDDFVHNLDYFSPDYVERFTLMAKKVNKNFNFVPCCYFRQITPEFVEKYGSFMDGILFPYRAESTGANLQDPLRVRDEIKKIREMFDPHIPIIIDIYATRHSRLGSSSAGYVRNVMKEGFKNADGVFIYRHQDPVNDEEKYQVIKEEFDFYLHNLKLGRIKE